MALAHRVDEDAGGYFCSLCGSENYDTEECTGPNYLDYHAASIAIATMKHVLGKDVREGGCLYASHVIENALSNIETYFNRRQTSWRAERFNCRRCAEEWRNYGPDERYVFSRKFLNPCEKCGRPDRCPGCGFNFNPEDREYPLGASMPETAQPVSESVKPGPSSKKSKPKAKKSKAKAKKSKAKKSRPHGRK